MSVVRRLSISAKTFLFSAALAGISAMPAAAQHSAVIDLPDSIMAPGTQMKWVKKVPKYCEGPAVDLSDGTVYFTEQLDNGNMNWPIWKINPANASDTGSRWISASNQSNGLFVDGQGRVIAAQKGKIVRYKKDASQDAVLATSGNGATFNQANDLSIGKDGSFYFTDLGSQAFFVDTQGKLKVVATGLSSANGIEWLEDEKVVHIQAGGNRVFDAASDGMLTNGKTFYPVPGPDGCEVDSHGNWYMASYTEGKVFVANAKGTKIGEITFKMESGQYDARGGQQGNIDNCHFGGSGHKTLYCTGDGGLFSIDLKIPGRAWAAAVPVSARPLLRDPAAKAARTAYRADGRWWQAGVPKGSPAPRLPILRD